MTNRADHPQKLSTRGFMIAMHKSKGFYIHKNNYVVTTYLVMCVKSYNKHRVWYKSLHLPMKLHGGPSILMIWTIHCVYTP